MATYGSNILPTQAAYYSLSNATISNGVLSLSAGGKAVYEVPYSTLAKLTEYFQVSISASTNWYSPTLYFRVNIKTTSGDYYTYTCTPTSFSNEIYKAELQVVAEEYESFVVTIYATQAVSVTLWELAPQALNEDVQTEIDGVKQSLPRLIYDYNTSQLSFGQQETSIGIISCYLIQATDVQGHFLMAYTASQICTITLRFKDNEATELFAPLIYDVHAGRGTIGVPHAYLDRLGGYHTFTVTAQCSTGTVTINTRDLLFTIDGGYLAERTLDIGANVSDMTFESGSSTDPSYIWIISVETGELLVRRRKYSKLTYGESFEAMYSLGEGKDGAIEFDGDWEYDEESADSLCRLITYEKPYCFLIDNDDNLYVQLGDTIASKTLLDTGVSTISVCRGFKSILYKAQDQGVIALYIKSGKAYYRQYAYDAATQAYMWLAAVEVTQVSGTVLSATVHRLNDYRVGFAITTTDTNYWLISSRTYVGQAFKPETFYASPTPYITVGMYSTDNIPTVSVTGSLGTDRKSIIATFNYPIQCVAYNPINFMNIPAALLAIINTSTDDYLTIEDNVLTIRTTSTITAQYTIELLTDYAWQFKFNNSWHAMSGSVSYTYDPYGHLSYTCADTTSFIVTAIAAASQIAVTQQGTSQADTVTLDPTVSTLFTLSSVTEAFTSQEDTVAFDPSVTTTLTLLQVGEEPI